MSSTGLLCITGVSWKREALTAVDVGRVRTDASTVWLTRQTDGLVLRTQTYGATNTSVLEGDGLCRQPLIQTTRPKPTPTTCFHASVRQSRFVVNAHAIDVHCTGLDLLGDPETSL